MNNTNKLASPRGCLARLVSLLHDVKWAMENFGSLHTNTQIPRRKIQSAIQRGYLTSIGMTQPCDANGAALENRQPREGWILTDAGVKFLEANVKCGGTAAQDSQSEANEGAYSPLPPTTCSLS